MAVGRAGGTGRSSGQAAGSEEQEIDFPYIICHFSFAIALITKNLTTVVNKMRNGGFNSKYNFQLEFINEK
jgi:hypothetical protein